ncbi:MAG: phosphoribosylanthranilate isomerase [Lentisphaeria bacterium]|nr:phosphoribosylanthranilate isomerase [Lentisphaeria bacterium]
MRVKICGIKNETELEIAVNAGADAVGFLVGQRFPSQDFILPDKAARLASLLPPFVSPVLVTHLTEPEEIAELVGRTGVTTVQLHGGSTPEQVQSLRKYFGGSAKLILAVHVGQLPEEVSPDPSAFGAFIDAFLLDSYDSVSGKVGGTGKTHNWQVSAKVVSAVSRPVILAGGLTPENVVEAVRTVRPYAVDVNSGVHPYGTLDARVSSAFVQNALHAFSSRQTAPADVSPAPDKPNPV